MDAHEHVQSTPILESAQTAVDEFDRQHSSETPTVPSLNYRDGLKLLLELGATDRHLIRFHDPDFPELPAVAARLVPPSPTAFKGIDTAWLLITASGTYHAHVAPTPYLETANVYETPDKKITASHSTGSEPAPTQEYVNYAPLPLLQIIRSATQPFNTVIYDRTYVHTSGPLAKTDQYTIPNPLAGDSRFPTPEKIQLQADLKVLDGQRYDTKQTSDPRLQVRVVTLKERVGSINNTDHGQLCRQLRVFVPDQVSADTSPNHPAGRSETKADYLPENVPPLKDRLLDRQSPYDP